MTPSFPQIYRATVTHDGSEGSSLAQLAAPPRPVLTGGAPPEFGGPAEVWSPEHLLLSSLGLCLYTTFEALARREQLAARRWTAAVEGTLAKTAAGLAFTGYQIDVELVVAAADVERARAVLARAERHCIITNALRAPVQLVARVEAG